MKTCLNCKYEPDWEMSNDAYGTMTGFCKWNKTIIVPSCYTLDKRPIVRFSCDTGVFHGCLTWESKENYDS